jgi:putative ABC transport system ATP-binding protein
LFECRRLGGSQPFERCHNRDDGQIWIGGELVMDGPDSQTDVRAFRRKHIGFVFQKSNLIDFLNARENVQIAMELNGLSHRAAGKRAQELLDSLGVGDRANHEVSMLSGGQQQRVAVARALANHPSVLLADEPTAALDSHRGRQVMELFRDVARQHGAGVIVVTHDHRTLDVFDRQRQASTTLVLRFQKLRVKLGLRDSLESVLSWI